MDICLLCLELKQETPQYIPVASEQWHEEKIGEIIEKHFWPLKHIASHSWLCMNCWNTLKEFHEFYLHIEDSHRSLMSLLKLEPQEYEINIEIDTNRMDKLETNDKDNNDSFKESLAESISKDPKNLTDLVTTKSEVNNQEQIMENEEENDELKNKPRTRRSKDPLQTTLNRKNKPKQRKSKRTARQEKIKNNLEKEEEIQNSKETKFANSDDKKNDKVQITEEGIYCDGEKANIDVETNENVDNLDVGLDSYLNNSDNEMDEGDNNANTQESTFIYPPKTKQEEADAFLTENIKITCDICQLAVKTFYELCKHFVQEHQQPGYVICCKKKFSSRSLLVDHVHCHRDPNYFKCNLCDKVMADRFCLKNHFKKHQVKIRSHICDTCGKAFTHPTNLKRHKLLHIPDEEKKYSCSECGKLFADNTLLANHFRFVHMRKYAHVCDICGTKLSGKDALERHQLKHKGAERPTVACNICGLKMIDPSYLKRHIATQHPEDGKKEFKCHLCPKVSPTLKSLKRHIVFKHETGYDFKCSICDKAFKKSSTLKEHMAAHSGTALYTCPHCPKTFNSNSNMHHHRKKIHPKEWEETCRARYSGNLPPNYKGPETTTDEIENQTMSYQFDVFI
ncbi:transcription factor grauzone-like [Musca vetustissima]|uniref:transcription factor grauzone-like n=1 Tax=Musca vetustissima TaxID=27455 RepID=UPI002AB76074|nr:transcription factor grauzone-like [Musca vetustissima]